MSWLGSSIHNVMEMQTNSYIFSKKNQSPVTLFGYSTKSLPGLEIHGLQKHGKTLKEKIIFITRSRQLVVPMRRFVLACDELDSFDAETVKWLEFPLLILYWHLAKIIPMSRLDNCLSAGHIHPNGLITIRVAPEMIIEAINQNWILLSLLKGIEAEHFSPKEIMSDVPGIKWREFPLGLQTRSAPHHSFSNNLLKDEDKLYRF